MPGMMGGMPSFSASAGGGGPSGSDTGGNVNYNDGSFVVGTSAAGTAVVGGIAGLSGTLQQLTPYLVVGALVWFAIKHHKA